MANSQLLPTSKPEPQMLPDTGIVHSNWNYCSYSTRQPVCQVIELMEPATIRDMNGSKGLGRGCNIE